MFSGFINSFKMKKFIVVVVSKVCRSNDNDSKYTSSVIVDLHKTNCLVGAAKEKAALEHARFHGFEKQPSAFCIDWSDFNGGYYVEHISEMPEISKTEEPQEPIYKIWIEHYFDNKGHYQVARFTSESKYDKFKSGSRAFPNQTPEKLEIIVYSLNDIISKTTEICE
jgi:hypothetical protein